MIIIMLFIIGDNFSLLIIFIYHLFLVIYFQVYPELVQDLICKWTVHVVWKWTTFAICYVAYVLSLLEWAYPIFLSMFLGFV